MALVFRPKTLTFERGELTPVAGAGDSRNLPIIQDPTEEQTGDLQTRAILAERGNLRDENGDW
ncbi:MAG: hypothetical protein SFV81_28240 [Pirellulaceae bacterium]|nr:hypothetical protein [Pirellulaceae bacterium]